MYVYKHECMINIDYCWLHIFIIYSIPQPTQIQSNPIIFMTMNGEYATSGEKITNI